MKQDTINIYRSRKQLLIAVLGSVGFVALGVFMYTRTDFLPLPAGHTIGQIIALAAILFFGLCALAGGYFYFFKKSDPAVILSPESLSLHNGDGSRYEIAWRQIKDFEAVEWMGQVVLAIHIADPERAIAAESNPLYRKSLEFNNKRFETPYCLIPSTLDYPKGALIPLLRRCHARLGTWTNQN